MLPNHPRVFFSRDSIIYIPYIQLIMKEVQGIEGSNLAEDHLHYQHQLPAHLTRPHSTLSIHTFLLSVSLFITLDHKIRNQKMIYGGFPFFSHFPCEHFHVEYINIEVGNKPTPRPPIRPPVTHPLPQEIAPKTILQKQNACMLRRASKAF